MPLLLGEEGLDDQIPLRRDCNSPRELVGCGIGYAGEVSNGDLGVEIPQEIEDPLEISWAVSEKMVLEA